MAIPLARRRMGAATRADAGHKRRESADEHRGDPSPSAGGRLKDYPMKLEMLSKHPLKSGQPTPLLFIHGMLHGAWCWDVNFLDYFAQHGFAAYAVNLRGHGNSEGRQKLRWARIADFVEDVADVARKLPSPPILIGHSMGGSIIQKYL